MPVLEFELRRLFHDMVLFLNIFSKASPVLPYFFYWKSPPSCFFLTPSTFHQIRWQPVQNNPLKEKVVFFFFFFNLNPSCCWLRPFSLSLYSVVGWDSKRATVPSLLSIKIILLGISWLFFVPFSFGISELQLVLNQDTSFKSLSQSTSPGHICF